MNMWKAKLRRGFALFLALVMCVSLLQLTALAADGGEEAPEETGVSEHVHNAEGWICTPCCGIPAHTHSSACYRMVDDGAESSPTPLPDEIPVDDGTSTEVDDNGDPYQGNPGITIADGEGNAVDYIPPASGEDGDQDGGFLVGPEEPGSGDQTEEGEEPSDPAALPQALNEGEEEPDPAGAGVPSTQELEGEPVPLAMVPMLICGQQEHQHTDACGWDCEPNTDIKLHVPEDALVTGRVDLLEGVSAKPAKCGDWDVQIKVVSVTAKPAAESAEPAESREVEPEDGRWLDTEDGWVYTVEYAAYVETAATYALQGDSDTHILTTGSRTLETEVVQDTARIGETWYSSLQKAVDAANAGDTIELFEDVREDISSTDKSYTLDMRGHTVTGTGTTHVFTIKNPNGGTVTLKNGTITGGKAVVGGGIFAYGISKSKNSLVLNVENCTITGNTASGGYGGGVSLGYKNETSVTNATSYSNGTVVSGTWKDVQIVGNTGNGAYILGGNTYSGGGVKIVPYGDLQFENVTISGNTTSLGSKAGAAGLDACNTTFTMKNSEISNNVGGSADGVYINGYAVVKLSSGVVLKNNKGTSNSSFETMAGGLSWTGGDVTIDGAVIKNNTTSSGNYAGIYLKGLMYHSFNMTSGAIYDNGTSDSSLDVYVVTGKSVKSVKIIAANKMADPDVYSDYFAEYGYVWRKGSGSSATNIDTALSHGAKQTFSYKAVATTTPPAVAKIGETEYTTLGSVVEAAGADDTVVLAVTGDTTSINSTKDTQTIELSKAVTFDLANGGFKAAATDLFDLKEDGSLTLTGGGTLQGSVLVNGGSLTLNDQTNVSDANSITLNKGAVTLFGGHGTLNVTLAQGIFLTAAEDFTGKLSITLDQATLKELNGAALRDDVVLVKGLTAEAAKALVSGVSVKGLNEGSNTAVVVNEVGEIVLRKSDNPGVYLGGVLGNDENSGLSSKDPVASFEKALEIADAYSYDKIFIVGAVSVTGDEAWDTGRVVALLPVCASASLDILLSAAVVLIPLLLHVSPFPSCLSLFPCLPYGEHISLTLTNLVIDGGGKISDRDSFHPTIEGQVTATQSMIRVNGGALTIGDGAVLQNNMFYKNSELANGGAVTNNGGSVCLDGGEICYNSSIHGGGIYNNGGSLEIISGSIHDNTAESTGASGGGVVVMSGRAVMTGGEIYDNTAKGTNASGGGISIGSVNHLLVKGSPVFEMNGGTISGNVSYGVGGGVSAYHGETTITEGDIIGNSAQGNRHYFMEPDSAFAGGGLYIHKGAVGKLSNVEVTGNKTISGTTISSCAISCCYDSDVTITADDGMIIHGNQRDTLCIENKPYGVLFNPDSVYGPKISISRYTLGGGLFNWEHSGNMLSYNDLNRTVSPSSGIFIGKAHVSSEDIQRAQGAVKVRIADNTAGSKTVGPTPGAGIGCNGNMIIGSGSQSFELSKTVVGKENDSSEYTFQIALSRLDGASIYGESKVNNSDVDGAMGAGTVYGVLKRADESSENVQLPLVGMEVSGKTAEGILAVLKNGESLTLTDLPYGTLYTVTETDSNGAAVKWNVPGENEKTGASVSGEITSVFTTVSCVNDYTASLKITKTVEGGPDNVGASKEFKFIVTAPNADENGTYPVTDNNNAASTVTFVNGKAEISITGSGSKTISGLRAGSYKETEDAASASVEGYNWSHSIDKDPVDVQAGGVTEVTVRNTYKAPEPETVSLSVDKVWNDEGSSANRPGSILVALRNGSGL